MSDIQVILRGTDDQATAAIQRADASVVTFARSSRDAAIATAALNQSLRDQRAAADAMAAQIRALDPFQRTIQHTVPIARQLAVETQAVGAASVLTTRRVSQMAFGVQALSTGMVAGRVSAQGLVGALAAMAPAGPVGLAVAVIAALAAGLGIYTARAKAARQEQDQFTTSLNRFNELSTQALENQRLFAMGEQASIRFARRTATGMREATEAEATRLEELYRTIQRIDALLAGRPAGGHYPAGSGGSRGSTPRGSAARGQALSLEDLYAAAPGLNRAQSAADFARQLYQGAVAPMAGEGPGAETLAAAQFAASMDDMAASALAAADALTPVVNETLRLNDVLSQVGTLGAVAFEGLLAGLTSGSLSASAITRAILREVAMEARAKASINFAHGLAALANPITAPLAGGYFRAATAYGAVAVATGLGAAAGGGSGAGGGAGFTRAGAGSGGTSAGGTTYTTVIQFVTEDGRVLSQYMANRQARDQALGARAPGAGRVERVSVPGLAVVTGAV